jgi:hypothetical protein
MADTSNGITKAFRRFDHAVEEARESTASMLDLIAELRIAGLPVAAERPLQAGGGGRSAAAAARHQAGSGAFSV